MAGFWRVTFLAAVLVTVLGKAGGAISCYARPGCRASVEQGLRTLEQEGASLNSLDRLVLSFILFESKPAGRN